MIPNLINDVKNRHSCQVPVHQQGPAHRAKKNRSTTYVLQPLGKPVVANSSLPFLLLGSFQPPNGFVDEPTQHFRPDQISNSRSSTRRRVGEDSRVTKKTSDEVERRESGRKIAEDLEIWRDPERDWSRSGFDEQGDEEGLCDERVG